MESPSNSMDYPTKDVSLVGAAGVHAVVAQLSLRGLIALPTIRNTAGIDVVVTNKQGTWQANLQVKTSRSRVKFWPVGKNYAKWKSPNNFYVLLRFDKNSDSFETFLESSDKVAANCAEGIKRDEERGVKPWVPSFSPRNGFDQLKDQWEKFGREGVNHPVPLNSDIGNER